MISLGSTCATANYLNTIGIRQSSYPFDWCDINIKQLNQTLSTNFENYDDLSIVKYSENYPYYDGEYLTNNGSCVFKNTLGIKFAHELTEMYDIDIFKQKLSSRIEKFKQLNKPHFIRYEQGKQKSYYNEELLQLISNLTSMFKDFNLTLLVPYTFNIDKYPYINVVKYDCEYTDWKNELAFKELNSFLF